MRNMEINGKINTVNVRQIYESEAYLRHQVDNMKALSRHQVGTKSTTQSATQSTDPVTRLLICLSQREMSAGELRSALLIKHRPTFRKNYQHPALAAGLIEYTLPDIPNSRLQKYRLTPKGREFLEKTVMK